ncbi:MAG: hypothetical protein HWE27_11970 [Gammaproteobacteria bacterium]|nr:hypothetical protein [Gammaproteobacteria bacterium]
MKRYFLKKRTDIERVLVRIKDRNFDFINLNIGANSIAIILILLSLVLMAYNFDALNLDYLKSLSGALGFFLGFFALILGWVFLKYWKLDRKSSYIFHLTRPENIPREANIFFTANNLTFATSYLSKVEASELPLFLRRLLSVSIFFLLALVTLDNRGFDEVTELPESLAQSSDDFCPEKLELLEETEPKEGCALILKAFELGYAKNLGECEPNKVEVDKLEVCTDRRIDEPYFHYFSRKITNFVEMSVAFFSGNDVKNIRKKFDTQLEQLEPLKDYQVYAISAAPRASHHIWTNLPYPEPDLYHKFAEILLPSRCIEQFQNQTNTITVEDADERKYSQQMQHAYGQLLFNPNVNITAGFCKEYTIHWNAAEDACDQLATNPITFLTTEKVYQEVNLVMKRHDLAKIILALDDKLKEFETPESELDTTNEGIDSKLLNEQKKNEKGPITKSKIAKSEQQLRDKEEIVSFQCFVNKANGKSTTKKKNVVIQGTQFEVPTRYVTFMDSSEDSQIAMYKQVSRLMEDKFRYTQYNSQSELSVNRDPEATASENDFLAQPNYLMSRLEVLKNIDVFLGNEWVLKRDDLLEVYPYHVHLKNYVEKFRTEYEKEHGRL